MTTHLQLRRPSRPLAPDLAGISSIFLGVLVMTVPAAGSAAYAFTFSRLMFLASRQIVDAGAAARA